MLRYAWPVNSTRSSRLLVWSPRFLSRTDSGVCPTFHSDDSHDAHNAACAANGSGPDNAAPVVLTSGLPAEKRGLDKVEVLPAGSEPVLDASLKGEGRANNYGVPSNMPPGAATKRVEIIDIEDVRMHQHSSTTQHRSSHVDVDGPHFRARLCV
jgi:hypothetical protein